MTYKVALRPWKCAVLPANSENFIEPKHRFSGLRNGCQVSGISEVGKIPRRESSILAKGKPFYNSKHFSLSKKLFLLDFGRTNHEVLVRHDKFWVQQESNLWAADKHSRQETPYVFFQYHPNFGGFPRQLPAISYYIYIVMVIPKTIIQLWRCVAISPSPFLQGWISMLLWTVRRNPSHLLSGVLHGKGQKGPTRKLPVEDFRTLNFLLDGNLQ